MIDVYTKAVPCKALRCECMAPETRQFCLQHWRLIPRQLQKDFWFYGVDRKSKAFEIVMQDAIKAIDTKEKHGQQELVYSNN